MSWIPNPWTTKAVRYLTDNPQPLDQAELVAAIGRPTGKTPASKILRRSVAAGYLTVVGIDQVFSVGKTPLPDRKPQSKPVEVREVDPAISSLMVGRDAPRWSSIWAAAQSIGGQSCEV